MIKPITEFPTLQQRIERYQDLRAKGIPPLTLTSAEFIELQAKAIMLADLYIESLQQTDTSKQSAKQWGHIE